MTFRTFSTADETFDLLVEQYESDHPAGLNSVQFEEWKEKRMRMVQNRVLTLFTMWLEDHGLLDEEPHIAGRLTNFLSLIVAPHPLALTAKLILQDVERLV
jgi:son of sevenless